ncbi:hypothetical protein ACFQ0M_00355 [Kitasatospora aburaviensis]
MDILVAPGEVIHFDGDVTATFWRNTLVLRRRGDLSMPASSESGASDARVLEVTQLTRTEEWLGEDVRLIDNRASPAPVTRSLKASREWTRTLTLGENHRQAFGGHVGANLLWLSARGSIEAELQRTLSSPLAVHTCSKRKSASPSQNARPCGSCWAGSASGSAAKPVLLPDRSVHIVPYRVVVSVTFDQKIQDVTGLSEG